MTPEAIYTTIIISLSAGFFATSLIFAIFMEDKARYYVPIFVLVSILVTFVVETLLFGFPRLAFTPIQLIAVPVGIAITTGLFFFIINSYVQRNPF
jgi:hypothetical protein